MRGYLMIVCLFLGTMIGGVTIGGIFPSIYRISAPLVCRGQMEIKVVKYNVVPGETQWQNNVYCVDEITGEKRPINFLAFAVTSLIFSLAFFLLIEISTGIKRLNGKRADATSAVAIAGVSEKPQNPTTFRPMPQASKPDENTDAAGQDPAVSLKKLKELHDAGLITLQEYETKKAEILSKL